jgi:intracellular sulfur oxidation DsrE/DsrF family protein
MSDTSQGVPRRGFLGRTAAALMGLGATPRFLGAAPGIAAPQGDPDAWLRRLTAQHRILFDMPEFGAGIPALHILNYLNTSNAAYATRDTDINVVGTFHGSTTMLAANDATNDPAGTPWTRNPWRTVVHALGREFPAASIEALQRRGVLFIVCSNALDLYSGIIAGARSLEAAAVNSDIRANLLPGVVVVPAMVVAVERAQKAGLAYRRE